MAALARGQATTRSLQKTVLGDGLQRGTFQGMAKGVQLRNANVELRVLLIQALHGRVSPLMRFR